MRIRTHWNISIAIFVLAMSSILPLAAQDGHWLTGYYPIYAQNGTMSPSQLDYTKLTHVIYWGVKPNSDGSLNTTNYVSASTFASGATTLVTQAHAAGAKALIGIGGDEYDGFSLAFNQATTPANLSAFVSNIVNLMTTYQFDGVDINWEAIGAYPGDSTQFPAFIKALRTQLNTLNPTPLLTMPPGDTDQALIAPIYQNFDQINVQTYVMSGPYCGWVTWYNSPFSNSNMDFPGTTEPLPSVLTTFQAYTAAGIPLNKLGMGIQLAGVIWQGGAGTTTGGVTKPLQSWGDESNCGTNPDAPTQSYISYDQVVPLTTTAGYTVNFDSSADQSWLGYDPSGTGTTNEAKDRFVSYESPTSIAKKGADLASAAIQTQLGGSLGGVMLFELSGDYMPSAATGEQHPLITAANGMQSLLPGAVTNLTATPGTTSAVLNWTAATGAASYNVYTGTTATGTPVTATTNSTTLTNLTPGQPYSYFVEGVDAFGVGAGATVTFQITSSVIPTGVTATAGIKQVTIAWTPVTSAAGYNVLRSTVSGSGFTTLAAVTTSPYLDRSGTVGQTYYYEIAAKGSFGTSSPSSQVSATPLPALIAPTGLTATTFPGQVILSWHPVPNATSYNVSFNSNGSTAYSPLGTSANPSFTENGNFNGTTTYYYTVQAVNGSTVGPYSNVASAEPTVPLPRFPAAPTLGAGPGRVTLTWTAVPHAVGYYVLRSTTSGSGYVQLTTASPITATSYIDTTPYGGIRYCYVLEAYNSSGTSTHSAQACVTPTVPTPTGFTSSVANEIVTFTWNPVAGVSGYEVNRGTKAGGPYTTTIGSVSAPGVTVQDSSAAPGTPYFYVVVADYLPPGNLAAVFSPNSAQLAVTVPAIKIAAPTGVQAYVGQDLQSANISWTRVAGATSYNILRSTTSGGPYTLEATSLNADYLGDPATPGKTYYYVVQAVNAAGASANSAQASIMIPAAQIPGYQIFSFSVYNGILEIEQLDYIPGASAYQYYRSTSATGPFTRIYSGPSLIYTDTTAVVGTTYYYEMTASNSAGTSAFSPAESATIPAPPTGVKATAGNAQVALTWNAVASAGSYQVYSGTSSTAVNNLIGYPTSNSFIDTTAVNGTTYYYKVQSVGTDGYSTSTLSATVSATPVSATVAAPTGLTATTVNAAGSVTLNWTASTGSTAAYSYSVYGGNTPGGESATALATVANNATTATLTGLPSNRTWYFVVKAINGGTASSASNEAASLPRILWVPDYAGGMVQVRIGGGTTTTAITIDLPTCSPNSLAVNQNKLYVVCNSPDKILVYNATTIRAAAAGTLTISPTQTITSGDFSSLIGIAFDASNDLWVASNGNNDVLEFTAAQLAAATPADIVSLNNSPSGPAGLAFDTDGSLWVTGEYADGILLNFTPDQFGLGSNANPRYCAVTDPQGGICISQANLFLEPEGVAVFNGSVWVANNSTTGSNNLGGATPGRELVNLAVSGGVLSVKGTYGTTLPDTGGGTATSPFLCPGGLFASSTQLWLNDESYGEATPQCGANSDSASMTGGVFSFTSAELTSKPVAQAPTFTSITGRPGFGGIYVENDR